MLKNKYYIIFTGLIFLLVMKGYTQTEDSSFYQRKNNWVKIVDDFWGSGYPLGTKQQIFNTYADRLQKLYPIFGGLDKDWDSLRTTYFNKITESTSKGGFSAIMAHFAYEFKEMHTRMWDLDLENTIPFPGTPIYYLNTFTVAHFGASITTLDDNSLVVVKVVPEHPLGLEPGDIILGFEGIPWADLTDELFASDIPLGGWSGSTERSINYMKMTNAGMNWHLFNSIDIVKYSSGDTLHLSTKAFASFPQTEPVFNNPQLPVTGVSFPDFDPDHPYSGVAHGKISGTNYGYIYVSKHNYEAVNTEFGDAVSDLKNTDGLIIDLRWNTGGFQQLFAGISQLFNFNFKPLQILKRCSESDLYKLCPENFPYWFNWNQNDVSTYYDKPIAVLIGPNSQSFGDIFARTMEFHPMARFFGRPTNGAFAGQLNVNELTIEGWHVTAADFTMSDSESDSVSRARRAVQPDEEVWLTRDDLAKGEDTVVKRALEWIQEVNPVSKAGNEIISGFSLNQNYPNPFNPITSISYQLPESGDVELSVYNILGEKITALVSGFQATGSYSVKFDASHLASGVYMYTLRTNGHFACKKLMLLK